MFEISENSIRNRFKRGLSQNALNKVAAEELVERKIDGCRGANCIEPFISNQCNGYI